MANPILVTGAAGRVGGVGRTITNRADDLADDRQSFPMCLRSRNSSHF
jgi:hypothetical protein